MKFKWQKEINTLIIYVSDKWMLQQNFTAQKVIYLSEIFCVHWKVRFFSSMAVKLLLLFSKSSKTALLLAVLTRTREGCGLRKSNEQHKILAGIAGSLHFVVLKVCQKSWLIWKWRQDFWTKINSWIFWTAHVQSSNENVLEGSFNSGLWDQLHHWSDNSTEHLKFSKNSSPEKFGSNTEDVNASEGSEN